MTLGEKIKAIRLSKNITQANLAGDKITRNMLCLIEKGVATPSIETIKYIADTLETPIGYFLSDDDDIIFYQKKSIINDVYRAYKAKSYQSCINKISKLQKMDDELSFILTSAHFELGKTSLMRGELVTAKNHFELAENNAKNTALHTSHITNIIPMYKCVCENVQTPLLNFDAQKFENELPEAFDIEFYNYLIQNANFDFKTDVYKLHLEAKTLIKNRRYSEALPLLLNAVETSKTNNYNAYLLFTAYTDLEYCYKQLYDFENAYLYSSKRLSLIEGFKS